MTAAKCPATGKVQHASEGRAWAHVRELRRVKGASVDLLPYRCEQCSSWHVGHSAEALGKRIHRTLRRAR